MKSPSIPQSTGSFRIGRDLSPADQLLPLLGNDFVDCLLAGIAFLFVGRQKYDPDAVLARFGKRHAAVLLNNFV